MLGRRRLMGLGLAALPAGALPTGTDTLFAQDEHTDGVTGTLTGRVTDAAGVPLAGANVTLLSSSLDAGDLMLTTDVDGRFTLVAAPAGLYDVQAALDGFQDGVVGAVPVHGGQTAQATVVLERRGAVEGGY